MILFVYKSLTWLFVHAFDCYNNQEFICCPPKKLFFLYQGSFLTVHNILNGSSAMAAQKSRHASVIDIVFEFKNSQYYKKRREGEEVLWMGESASSTLLPRSCALPEQLKFGPFLPREVGYFSHTQYMTGQNLYYTCVYSHPYGKRQVGHHEIVLKKSHSTISSTFGS